MIQDAIQCILTKGTEGLLSGDKVADTKLVSELTDHLDFLDLLGEGKSISAKDARRALEILEKDLATNKLRAVRQSQAQVRLSNVLAKEVDEAGRVKKFVQSQTVAHEVFTKPELRYDALGDAVNNKLAPIMRGLQEGSYVRNSREVALELFNPNTNHPLARQILDLRHKLERMYESAGGILKRRKDYGIGISHRADIIMNSSKKGWSSFLMSKLDLDMTAQNMGVKVEQVEEVLGEMYEVIVSDGVFAVNMNSRFKKVISPRNIHRVLRFADGEKWLEYNNKFGTGDLSHSIIGYFDKMSKDIAVLETLGPEAEKTLMHLSSKLTDPANSKRAYNMLQDASRMWGSGFKSTSPRTAQFMKSTKNLLSASSLGMTTIDALLIDPINGAFSRYVRGIDLQGAARGLSESEMREAGYLIDGFMEDLAEKARYTMDSSKFGPLPHTLFKVNGLQGLTRFYRNMNTKAAHTSISRQLVTGKWKQGTLDLLKRHDLTTDDLSKLDLSDTDYGLKIIDLNGAAFKGGEQGNIAKKLLSAMYEVRSSSVITSDAASRAIFSRMKASGALGTILGESMGTFLGYFQGWWRHIGSRVVRDLANNPGKLKQVGALGIYIPFLIMGGYASTSLRWTLQGKKIKDFTNPELLKEALARSGILGYASDYIFTDTRGFGRNTVSRLMGMPLGVAGDIAEVVKAAATLDLKSGDVIRLLRTFTPGRSLPGVGIGLDRLVFDQLRMLTEPDASRKIRASQRRVEKMQGVKYLWDRGR